MEGSKARGGGGGGEVRKVHIVYFLSHDGGKIEQPHLLRVHHLHRNGGVHLRDVKSWLSDVRGEDMPDSYAWSYKRHYKSGYVWQDLKDDDLITPFSDNEYVLKGSEIASKNDNSPPLETSAVEEEEAVQVPTPKTPRRRGALCPPPPPSVSDASDEPLERAAADVKVDLWEQIQDRHNKLMEKETNAKKLRASSARHHRSDSGGGGSWWSGRRKTSSLLRNLLRCGAVETSNSTLPVQRRKKNMHIDSKNTAKFSASTNSRQCGKAFRPEKLHLHTKSCRGLEASTNASCGGVSSTSKGGHRYQPSDIDANAFNYTFS